MAEIFRQNGLYYVQYKAQGLIFRKPAGRTEQAARRLLKEIEEQAGPEEYCVFSPSIGLTDFIERYEDDARAHFTERSFKRLRAIIQKFYLFIQASFPEVQRIGDLRPVMPAAFLHEGARQRQDILSLNVLRFYVLSDMLDYAVRSRVLNENFMVHLRQGIVLPDNRPVCLSSSDQEKLKRTGDPDTRFWMALVMATGLTPRECRRLRWEMLDTTAAALRWSEARQWTLPKTLQRVLSERRKKANNTGWIRPGVTPEKLKEEVERAMRVVLGAEKAHWEALRNVFIQQLFVARVPWRRIVQWIGINDLKGMIPYSHFDPVFSSELPDR